MPARFLSPPHDASAHRRDIESIDALVTAVKQFRGGVILVSHDARLILETECQLWVCGDSTVRPFDGDFDEYRDRLLEELRVQEEAVEVEMRRKAEAAAAERTKRMTKIMQRGGAGGAKAGAAAAAGAGTGKKSKRR